MMVTDGHEEVLDLKAETCPVIDETELVDMDDNDECIVVIRGVLPYRGAVCVPEKHSEYAKIKNSPPAKPLDFIN